MNTYGQYCPTAKAVEVLGDRWTLLIVRDLLGGTNHFNALERGLPGIPKAVLTNRLKRLQQSGVVTRLNTGPGSKTCYELTPAGLELLPIINALTQWGARWAFGEPDERDLNPSLLLWWMHNRVRPDHIPEMQVVIEFYFSEAKQKRYWLVLKPGDVSVCLQHPGYEIDLLVTANLSAMLQVWLGRIEFDDALRERLIRLEGPPALVDGFPSWFALSPTAGIVREAARSGAKKENPR